MLAAVNGGKGKGIAVFKQEHRRHGKYFVYFPGDLA